MNLRKCQIFTPKNIVMFMLDSIEYNNDIFGKYIIDNSCGDGSFLVEVVSRFINDAKSRNISNRKIKKILLPVR